MRAKKAAEDGVVEATSTLIAITFVPVVCPVFLLIVAEHAFDDVGQYPLERRDIICAALVLGVLELKLMTLIYIHVQRGQRTMSSRLLKSVGFSAKSSKYGSKLGNVAQVRLYTL